MTDSPSNLSPPEVPDNGAWFSESLDVVASLSRTLCDIPMIEVNAERILFETGIAMQRLVEFEAVAFVMCDDDGMGFDVSHCWPEEARDSMVGEVDQQIEQQVFAWVLRQNRSVIVPTFQAEGTLMMHVLATESRLLGMFIGRFVEVDREIPAASQKLATIVLLHCASVLESRRLQGQLNELNRHLEETVEERTRELRTSERLAQSASRAKSEFLANMSHELRTPMNGILGMARILGETELTGEQFEILGTIIGSSSGLLAIMNDVLEYARLDSGNAELSIAAMDLSSVAQGVLDLISAQAKNSGVELRFNYCEEMPRRFFGDASRIRQVLLNLLGNAIKFTRDGYIELRIERESTDAGHTRIRISVEDTGMGISEEGLERIFEHFSQVDTSSTREFGGTGLGLAITQRLVGLMGGAIGATSLLGEGSTFYFSLDLELDASSECRQQESPDPEKIELVFDPIASGVRISALVVEDNPTNQLVVRKMLEKMGCEVRLANNGLEGVQMVEQIDFDIVFMDCQMPEMDGYSATTWIRRMEQGKSRVPIVAVTANAMRGDREKCLDAGMDDYLSKPIDPTALRRALEFWTSPRNRGIR